MPKCLKMCPFYSLFLSLKSTPLHTRSKVKRRSMPIIWTCMWNIWSLGFMLDRTYIFRRRMWHIKACHKFDKTYKLGKFSIEKNRERRERLQKNAHKYATGPQGRPNGRKRTEKEDNSKKDRYNPTRRHSNDCANMGGNMLSNPPLLSPNFMIHGIPCPFLTVKLYLQKISFKSININIYILNLNLVNSKSLKKNCKLFVYQKSVG